MSLVRALCIVLLALAVEAAPGQAPRPFLSTQVGPSYSEESILLAFKAGITNWEEVSLAWGLRGWQLGVPVCTWSGLQCSPFVQQGSRVTAMDLTCRGCSVPLEGRLLPSLQQLQFLEVLHLSNNSFSGLLPPEWGDPGSFPVLRELDMNNNQLTGPFPDAWSIGPAFNNLYNLQIANNRLSGTFPQSFATTNTSFSSLLQFNIGGNRFHGPLPTYIRGMLTLSAVGLQDNQFTGALPAEWGTRTFPEYGTLNITQALQFLWLHGNDLSGTLPDAWASPDAFPGLTELTLGNNPRLKGTLPASWGAASDSMPKLQRINISNTGICGPLPDWGPYPAQLQEVDLSGNNITGTVPASWMSLSDLDRVVMQPGNPGMCTYLPANAPFSLCWSGDFLCSAGKVQASNWTTCRLAAAAHSSSFPVVAVAVPITVVAAAALLAAGYLAWQRRHARAVSGRLAQQPTGNSKAELAEQFSALPSSSQSLPNEGLPTPKQHISSPMALLQHASSSRAASTPHSVGGGFGSTRASTPHSGGGAFGDNGTGEPVFSDVELQVMPDWQIAPEDIQILQRADGSDWQLGSGGFGTVYKALFHGVQPVAVKVLSTTVSDMKWATKQAAFAQEIAILRACRNANILQFQGACVADDRLMLVTEYMEGGNLMQNLAAKRVSWYRKGKKIAMDIAKALVYLHSRRIVHFDVKSSNCLLQRDGTAKLGDVGLAKTMAEGYVSSVSNIGTLAWSSPELLMGQRCGPKTDIFSFGVVLWEICTGELPHRGQMRDPIVPQECPAEVLAIMQRCFSLDPAARPTAVELVELLAAAPAPPSSNQLSTSTSLQLAQTPSMRALSRCSTAESPIFPAAEGLRPGAHEHLQRQPSAARPPLSRPPSLRNMSPFELAQQQPAPWEVEEREEAANSRSAAAAATAAAAPAPAGATPEPAAAAVTPGPQPASDIERGESLTALSPFHQIQ